MKIGNSIDVEHTFSIAADTQAKRHLRVVVALMLVIAALALAIVFLSSSGPDAVIVEQGAARVAEWEHSRTDEDRVADIAWKRATSEITRHRRLIAAVFLAGNLLIVLACVRATGSFGRELVTGRLHLDEAFANVLFRATIALGIALGIMAATPAIELVTVGGGMYSGERVLAAMVTAASFFVAWTLALCLAFLALWRGSRVVRAIDFTGLDRRESVLR